MTHTACPRRTRPPGGRCCTAGSSVACFPECPPASHVSPHIRHLFSHCTAPHALFTGGSRCSAGEARLRRWWRSEEPCGPPWLRHAGGKPCSAGSTASHVLSPAHSSAPAVRCTRGHACDNSTRKAGAWRELSPACVMSSHVMSVWKSAAAAVPGKCMGCPSGRTPQRGSPGRLYRRPRRRRCRCRHCSPPGMQPCRCPLTPIPPDWRFPDCTPHLPQHSPPQLRRPKLWAAMQGRHCCCLSSPGRGAGRLCRCCGSPPQRHDLCVGTRIHVEASLLDAPFYGHDEKLRPYIGSSKRTAAASLAMRFAPKAPADGALHCSSRPADRLQAPSRPHDAAG
jgi:hypothetical protein